MAGAVKIVESRVNWEKSEIDREPVGPAVSGPRALVTRDYSMSFKRSEEILGWENDVD